MKTTWHRLQVQQQYVVKFYNNKFNRRPDAKYLYLQYLFIIIKSKSPWYSYRLIYFCRQPGSPLCRSIFADGWDPNKCTDLFLQTVRAYVFTG